MNASLPQIISVESSAGSGKTYILAKRYVKLLFDLAKEKYKIPPSAILAVTFTNKAAFEMKVRIFDLLKKTALDKFDNVEEKKDLISFLGYDFIWLKEKAGRLIDEIILNFSSFRMQTIDSFMHDIICASAYKINISKDFSIKDDPTAHISYCLDNLLIKARESGEDEKIFSSFAGQYMDIENKSSWFIKDNILSTVKMMFFDSNNYVLEFKKNNLKVSSVILKKKKIILLLKKIHKAAVSTISAFLNKTNSGAFKLDDFPAPILKISGELIKELEEISNIEAHTVFDSYIDIFNLVMRNVKALEDRSDFLFLSELAKKTAQIFGDGFISAPEIYLKLSSRFMHYLIDEFQDTSFIQLNNFLPLFEEALSTGGSLFYVADKKQSLYRFRGADPALSDEVIKRYGAYKNEKIFLNKNYRSRKNIVEFNNILFSGENLKRFFDLISLENDLLRENFGAIIERFENSFSDYKKENELGRVKVELIENTSEIDAEDLIKEKVIALIKKLSNNHDLGDIALICRTNNEVEIISDWLLENDIPVESEKTLNIKRNAYIKEIISFYRFLGSPSDNISFSSFLLGRIFAGSSSIGREEIEGFIFGCRNKRRDYCLYREFELKYPDASRPINNFLMLKDNISIYEFTVKFIEKYGILKNCADSRGYLIKFLEIILKYESEYYNLSSFLKFFDALEQDIFLNAKNSNAVKVLTYHKSKGLEFGAVIIPFLKLSAKLGQSKEGSHYHIDLQDGAPRLIYLKKTYTNYSDDLKKIYYGEYAKSLGDELNSIYVALTRAKNELYCFVPQKSGRSRNLFLDLLPSNNIDLGGERYYKEEKKYPPHSLKITNSEISDVFPLIQKGVDASILSNRQKILRGDALHFILSSIGVVNSSNYKKAVNIAVQNAYPRYGKKELENYKKIILKIILNKDIRKFFFIEGYYKIPRKGKNSPLFGKISSANISVYTEKEVISKDGSLKRIDRLIVFENEVWVIDYKSTKEDHWGHLRQMEEYKKIINSLYQARSVKGFIIYLDSAEVVTNA